MKAFELSSKAEKNGRRKFKAILFKIHPDSCVDEVNEVGTEYNLNGITWLRDYCEAALPSINGMSLRCEFTDDDRTEILGHGATAIVDGIPVYENAVVIGNFTNAYIEDDVQTDDGPIIACIGEGEIDAQCYHNFAVKLEEDLANGIFPSGSIELMHTTNNENIIYKYGYKEKGRIPMDFIFSGYALLGIAPADNSAKLIELNEQHKEELNMNADEVKALVTQVLSEYTNHEAEINQCKNEYEQKIAELNSTIDNMVAEKNELVAGTTEIQAALNACRDELEQKCQEMDALYDEKHALEKALGEAKARERIGEMNAAIADFSDDERAYAADEIAAFEANPEEVEINSIVNKIWEGIGRNYKANVKVENNSVQAPAVEDIFGEVGSASKTSEEIDIFG